MLTILTSSPTKDLNGECPHPALNEQNGFVECLRQVWPDGARCLMVAADPAACAQNDEMTGFYYEAVVRAGLAVSCFDVWDFRCPALLQEELWGYDVVFLAGGHVPTQHRWFELIRLRELLQGFEGLLIGTSAGSMNAARVVYAWPEMEGETLDPDYELFFQGLGLAETQIMPHYQKVKDGWLDGKRLIDDIAASHSYGERFLVLSDGSYVLVEDGVETVFGEARVMTDGQLHWFCGEGECRVFWPPEQE